MDDAPTRGTEVCVVVWGGGGGLTQHAKGRMGDCPGPRKETAKPDGMAHRGPMVRVQCLHSATNRRRLAVSAPLLALDQPVYYHTVPSQPSWKSPLEVRPACRFQTGRLSEARVWECGRMVALGLFTVMVTVLALPVCYDLWGGGGLRGGAFGIFSSAPGTGRAVVLHSLLPLEFGVSCATLLGGIFPIGLRWQLEPLTSASPMSNP